MGSAGFSGVSAVELFEGPVVLAIHQPARETVRVVLTDRLTVGRDCDGFLLADARASRRHAEFRHSGGRVSVIDLGSSNGTVRRGHEIDGDTELSVGDVVRIGSTEIVVEGSLAPAAAPTPSGGATEMIATSQDRSQRGSSQQGSGQQRPVSSLMRVADSVHSDAGTAGAPEMLAPTSEGTFTIVFSDIEASTQAATALGDDSWMKVLDGHNRIVRQELKNHRGREIKSQGDGFMMSFSSARKAVQFAIAVQRAIAAHSRANPDRGVRVRFGVHTGEALRSLDGDLFGRHVIIASRIADQALGGEILVSGLVRELTAGKIDLRYSEARNVQLKGIGAQSVHAVYWLEDDGTDPVEDAPVADAAAENGTGSGAPADTSPSDVIP